MKATLEFNLPEDREEFMRAAKSTDLALAIWHMLYDIKKRVEPLIKTGHTPEDILDLVADQLWDISKENNVNIEELIS